MPAFVNLGDLVDRDRDAGKVAVVDLGGEGEPRELDYAAIDAMASGVARALLARGLARLRLLDTGGTRRHGAGGRQELQRLSPVHGS